MHKILDKLLTSFFVGFFAIIWICSIRQYDKPDKYKILIYDLLGKEVFENDLRTVFKTKKVANGFINEYQRTFPYYDFILATDIPNVRKKWFLVHR